MAGTINLNISGQVTNGNYSNQFNVAQSISQTGQGAYSGIVTVGTATENLKFGDVSTEGIVWGRNLDATNFVTIGPTTSTGSTSFHPMIDVDAGEPFAFRVNPAAKWKWKADTGAVKMQIHMSED